MAYYILFFFVYNTPSEEFVNRETGEHYEDLNQMLKNRRNENMDS